MAVAKARPSAGLRMSTFRHSEEIMNKSFGVLTLCMKPLQQYFHLYVSNYHEWNVGIFLNVNYVKWP